MTERTFAKKEAELYPSISDLLESQGYQVWEQATVRAGDEGTRTVDHVAWKWIDSKIDALAVEVKPGRADAALAQAVAYATGFDHVYVAAEEPLDGLGYLRKVLDRLGLGYIDVDPESARLETQAATSDFVVNAVHAENLARIRLKHLFTDDVLGEPVTFGKDNRGGNWAVTGDTSLWQLMGQIEPGTRATSISLLAESKWIGDRAAARIDADELYARLADLDGAGTLLLRERHHNGFRATYSDVLASWAQGKGPDGLDELLARARTIAAKKQRGVGPHFELETSLWRHTHVAAEAECRTELRDRIERLRTIQAFLNESLK